LTRYLDVVKNSWRLENEFIPKTFYSRALGSNLMALFHRNLESIRSQMIGLHPRSLIFSVSRTLH